MMGTKKGQQRKTARRAYTKAYRRGKKPMSKTRAKAMEKRKMTTDLNALVGRSVFKAKKVKGGWDLFVKWK